MLIRANHILKRSFYMHVLKFQPGFFCYHEQRKFTEEQVLWGSSIHEFSNDRKLMNSGEEHSVNRVIQEPISDETTEKFDESLIPISKYTKGNPPN
jgi:hypothetical protein